jgi:hypothetical protein
MRNHQPPPRTVAERERDVEAFITSSISDPITVAEALTVVLLLGIVLLGCIILGLLDQARIA